MTEPNHSDAVAPTPDPAKWTEEDAAKWRAIRLDGARALEKSLNQFGIRKQDSFTVGELYDVIDQLIATAWFKERQLAAAQLATPVTVEWAIQERQLLDGPWDRLDDGRGWTDRHGAPYTEAEVKAEINLRSSLIDPKLWRRAVTRTVHYGEWTPTDPSSDVDGK